jgi:predicted nucleotidyltransferase
MMTMKVTMEDSRLRDEVAAHPHPLLFATVSGAHLYGFPSPDSDWDLRGSHLLPLGSVAGLLPGDETVKSTHVRGGAEIDLVTHDARKFFTLLLRDNGYVLEQLYSPLVVHTTPEHEELLALARACFSRRLVRHYLGFAHNQWRFFEKESPRRVKPLLYVYRVLLTGLRVMRTGELNASLPECNAEERLSYVDELIARKTSGTEHGRLDDANVAFHQGEYLRLSALLAESVDASPLPPEIGDGARAGLHDLLLRLRLSACAGC